MMDFFKLWVNFISQPEGSPLEVNYPRLPPTSPPPPRSEPLFRSDFWERTPMAAAGSSSSLLRETWPESRVLKVTFSQLSAITENHSEPVMYWSRGRNQKPKCQRRLQRNEQHQSEKERGETSHLDQSFNGYLLLANIFYFANFIEDFVGWKEQNPLKESHSCKSGRRKVEHKAKSGRCISIFILLLHSWEWAWEEKNPQTPIPSRPFQFSHVQNAKRDSERGRKKVYTPPETLSNNWKTGMRIIVINVMEVQTPLWLWRFMVVRRHIVRSGHKG